MILYLAILNVRICICKVSEMSTSNSCKLHPLLKYTEALDPPYDTYLCHPHPRSEIETQCHLVVVSPLIAANRHRFTISAHSYCFLYKHAGLGSCAQSYSVWQANVDKYMCMYFLIFDIHVLILETHFLIFETHFLIFETHFLIFENHYQI